MNPENSRSVTDADSYNQEKYRNVFPKSSMERMRNPGTRSRLKVNKGMGFMTSTCRR